MVSYLHIVYLCVIYTEENYTHKGECYEDLFVTPKG